MPATYAPAPVVVVVPPVLLRELSRRPLRRSLMCTLRELAASDSRTMMPAMVDGSLPLRLATCTLTSKSPVFWA